MITPLKMPTYNELVALSTNALMQRIALALGEVDKAEKHHENMIDKAKIYLAYRNELAKRNYARRARW
jgi:hypothetical protein